MHVCESEKEKSGVHVSKTNSFCSSSQISPHFSHKHINTNKKTQLTIYLSDDDDDDDYNDGSICSLCAHCEVGSSELY